MEPVVNKMTIDEATVMARRLTAQGKTQAEIAVILHAQGYSSSKTGEAVGKPGISYLVNRSLKRGRGRKRGYVNPMTREQAIARSVELFKEGFAFKKISRTLYKEGYASNRSGGPMSIGGIYNLLADGSCDPKDRTGKVTRKDKGRSKNRPLNAAVASPADTDIDLTKAIITNKLLSDEEKVAMLGIYISVAK